MNRFGRSLKSRFVIINFWKYSLHITCSPQERVLNAWQWTLTFIPNPCETYRTCNILNRTACVLIARTEHAQNIISNTPGADNEQTTQGKSIQSSLMSTEYINADVLHLLNMFVDMCIYSYLYDEDYASCKCWWFYDFVCRRKHVRVPQWERYAFWEAWSRKKYTGNLKQLRNNSYQGINEIGESFSRALWWHIYVQKYMIWRQLLNCSHKTYIWITDIAKSNYRYQ